MVFLPGAFVSVSLPAIPGCTGTDQGEGIFGTNFFSPPENAVKNPDQSSYIVVSSQWWLLSVTIIPLTTLIPIGWLVSSRRKESEIDLWIKRVQLDTWRLQESGKNGYLRKQKEMSNRPGAGNGWLRSSRRANDLEMDSIPV